MKTITRLNKKMQLWTDDISEADAKHIPDVRQLILNQLSIPKGKDKDESYDRYLLTVKLLKGRNDDTLELEDSEYRLASRLCDENALGWGAYHHGFMVDYFKDMDKANEKPKE